VKLVVVALGLDIPMVIVRPYLLIVNKLMAMAKRKLGHR
jgi:hypothetical protein